MGFHAKRRVFGVAAAAVLTLALGGCAATESLPYPNLGAVKRIKERILSKEEQDAQIKEMAEDEKSHKDKAIREIERR
ncbi:MAG: hypothetical protein VX871_04485 [Pseudomonadota bacterium]|nr:hypothetical protein [Pseudomonadota bacterium]